MKPIKLFEEFYKESMLNETVYSTGLDGMDLYSVVGDLNIKKKTIQFLKTEKWQKTDEGKFAMGEAQKIANIWNLKDPSLHPKWFSEYTTDIDGKLKPSNFISVTALIVAVLNHLSKPVKAEWLDSGLKRNYCFDNSAQWATRNNGTPIGGICIPKSAIQTYKTDTLVVHAFVQKDNKYYEVTIPSAKVTADTIYWPLIQFDQTIGPKISKDIWSLSLGIEEGVKEYLLNL